MIKYFAGILVFIAKIFLHTKDLISAMERPQEAYIMTKIKKLIVNADDFGLHTLINRGIIKGHREGFITSTSIMPMERFS